MWKHNKLILRKAAGSILRLLLPGMILILAGCATNTSPLPQRYNKDGTPYSYKRVERFPQRDFFHHFVRTAYRKPAVDFLPPPGTDQALIFRQWGRPDYVRKPFRSVTDERVQEWIYLDKTYLFQYVGNQLVFEGPMKDYEQTLILRGYPDRQSQILEEDHSTVAVFIYWNLFEVFYRLDEFHFVNGVVTQSQEGN